MAFDEMRVASGFLMFVSLLCICCLPRLNAQSSARSLDALLQEYAFRAFVRPRTGIPCDGHVPHNLSGIKVSAMRLRSGSLRIRGFDSYKEFQIPLGVVEQPYTKRVVLVYHNLGNWSSVYYPLPGYSYLAPVLGLLAYNASNLTAANLPELDIRAYDKPILIKFPDVRLTPVGSSPVCVYFDLHGSVEFNNVLPGNVCSATQEGHFSIVVESNAPSPAPVASDGGSVGSGEGRSKVWIIVGSLVGGVVLMVMLVLLIVSVKGCEEGKRVEEWAAEGAEDLQISSIGNTRAPLAMGTRTRPVLENEYVS